jgi:hypothetical protein
MNALDLLFRTDRFNLSKVGEHFINPCCYGEDVVAWLGDKLRDRGIEPRRPYQEDWGWELPVRHSGNAYYLCVSGNAANSVLGSNEGEWRIIVEKKRSTWKRLTGKGKIARDEPILSMVGEILRADPAIRDVHVECVEERVL